jgi:hypothetical protein
MLTGRNGSLELKRAPNGWRTPSTNCCVLAYFLDTADLPVNSQVTSSAKMLVMYPVPFAQEGNASATISRSDPWLISLRTQGQLARSAMPG